MCNWHFRKKRLKSAYTKVVVLEHKRKYKESITGILQLLLLMIVSTGNHNSNPNRLNSYRHDTVLLYPSTVLE